MSLATILVIILISLVVLVSFVIKRLFYSSKTRSIENKHIVITGGSSGIGNALARLAAERGAHVTIIARDDRKLNRALTDIRKARINEQQIIQAISLDVTDYASVTHMLLSLEETAPPIFMLINCAGLAIWTKIQNMSSTDMRNLMNINVLGTMYPIKVLLPRMKHRRDGIIVITASQDAVYGVYGKSVYSASKFALRGLAEAIDMEASPYNVSVTCALLPKTETHAYLKEYETIPIIASTICDEDDFYHPYEVARQIMEDALNGKFFSTMGWYGFKLSTLSVGMARYSSYTELLLQMILLGPLRLMGSYKTMFIHALLKKIIQKRYA